MQDTTQGTRAGGSQVVNKDARNGLPPGWARTRVEEVFAVAGGGTPGRADPNSGMERFRGLPAPISMTSTTSGPGEQSQRWRSRARPHLLLHAKPSETYAVVVTNPPF